MPYTFPAWNGKNPATGAKAPFAASFDWILTVTKNGVSSTRSGTILLSSVCFQMQGISSDSHEVHHAGYLVGSSTKPGSVNLYVSASSTVVDHLAIAVSAPGYGAVPTHSPWTVGPGAPAPATGQLTGSTAIRANAVYDFYVKGTTYVIYTVTVIE